MRRTSRAICLCLLAFAAWMLNDHRELASQPKTDPNLYWIWSQDATLQLAPDGSRFFRRVFDVKGAAKTATIEITADNHFTLWINGKLVGAGDEWQHLERFDVVKFLQAGKNAIAVEGRNDGPCPAGLLATLTFTDESGKQVIVTDKSWKSAQTVS